MAFLELEQPRGEIFRQDSDGKIKIKPKKDVMGEERAFVLWENEMRPPCLQPW